MTATLITHKILADGIIQDAIASRDQEALSQDPSKRNIESNAPSELEKLLKLRKATYFEPLEKLTENPKLLSARKLEIDKLKNYSGWAIKFNFTPLHNAIQLKYFQLAALLLTNNDVDVNALSISNTTPLHSAIIFNAPIFLLEAFLRDKKTNVNIANNDGNTALHFASAQYSNTESKKQLLFLLLKKGADQHARNTTNKSPIDVADRQGNIIFQSAMKMFETEQAKIKTKEKELASLLKGSSKKINKISDKIEKLENTKAKLREEITPSYEKLQLCMVSGEKNPQALEIVNAYLIESKKLQDQIDILEQKIQGLEIKVKKAQEKAQELQKEIQKLKQI